MKVALIGYGIEAQSAYRYLTGRGDDITIHDQSEQVSLPSGVQSRLGPDYLVDLDQYDLICRTPGVNPANILKLNPGVESKITSVIKLFLEHSPTKQIIGVTGTKGKGTTSTLIAKMLEAAGKPVFLGGNIGLPPLDFLDQLKADSWVVLELSSFQLIDLHVSPATAVCLMVVPEHLNWHANFEDYINAKGNIFRYQSKDDRAIYLPTNAVSTQLANLSPGQKIPYTAAPGAFINNGQLKIDGQMICAAKDVRLRGQHNLDNICAALTAVWPVVARVEPLADVITSFAGLPHRLEWVAEVDGVNYFDDSFGTTPETAIVAIEAFTEPKVVILGGSGKGAAYDELAKTVSQNNVRGVIAIGEEGPKIADALKTAGFSSIVRGGPDMASIVGQAARLTEAGDVVLLSTGCASFDMFENYKDRAAQFVVAVKGLPAARRSPGGGEQSRPLRAG